MKHHDILSCLLSAILFIPAISFCATAITGDAGFKLGDRFDVNKTAAEKLIIDKNSVYKVIPKFSSQDIEYILLRLTRDNRIHRITIFSNAISPAQCDSRKNKLRKSVESKYPNLGYYAMEESEMFIEDPRTLTIECVDFGAKNRLKTEYSDDALANFKVD